MKPNFLYVADSPLPWGQGQGPSPLSISMPHVGTGTGEGMPSGDWEADNSPARASRVTQADRQARGYISFSCFPFIMKGDGSSLLTKNKFLVSS